MEAQVSPESDEQARMSTGPVVPHDQVKSRLAGCGAVHLLRKASEFLMAMPRQSGRQFLFRSSRGSAVESMVVLHRPRFSGRAGCLRSSVWI